VGIKSLRQVCEGEVFDYGLLMAHLKRYKAPHRKITELLKSRTIVRVKKGLYLFGDEYRKNPIQLELLANLIFGPSYVSCEYALSFYGLIPERVETITSMTVKRHKEFVTPVGRFTYAYINPCRYTVGMDWVALGNHQHCFVASPEKALADTIIQYKDITTISDMLAHLIENMRIDEEQLDKLNLLRLEKIAFNYKSPVVDLLFKTIKRGT